MSAAAVERAGGGCGVSAVAVERGRVRWVVGGGGAGEGAGGRRRRWSGGRVRGVLGGEGDLARGIAIEREGDRDRVSS